MLSTESCYVGTTKFQDNKLVRARTSNGVEATGCIGDACSTAQSTFHSLQSDIAVDNGVHLICLVVPVVEDPFLTPASSNKRNSRSESFHLRTSDTRRTPMTDCFLYEFNDTLRRPCRSVVRTHHCYPIYQITWKSIR